MSNSQEDLDYCENAIKNGSLSFHAASRLLPRAVRNSCLALYAFCRLADDEVDLKEDKSASVYDLVERLEQVYSGKPRNLPMDRAFARMVEETQMPRALPEALIEGLVWDAMERRYNTFDELVAYSARVASAVGVMMCVIMRQRDSNVLARACDLGVAMQLTNIARDIGEERIDYYQKRKFYINAQNLESFAYQKLSGQPCFLHVTFTQQLDRKFETMSMTVSLLGLRRRGQKR
jgi:phytoene synthase